MKKLLFVLALGVFASCAGENKEAAADTLQEVFIKIFRQIDSYDSSKGRLYTWMLNIARNAAI
ncbi:MAG: hypothetical protein B7Z27_08035, partial [Sphingobacteriia bacterium 32-37-4]